MKVLIIGGGIGGLTTALALHAQGIECAVYEQAGAIKELGVGINPLPHAIKELAALGLLERLDEVGIRTHELFMTDRFGGTVWHELRGVDAGYDYPQFSIHRGKLQGVLHEAVQQRMPGAVHVGHRLSRWEQDADGVTAWFTDRDGAEVAQVRGDALIGADGIHSAVRGSLFPDEGQPRWNGIMMWRGATDWPKFLTGRSMFVSGGNAAKLVLYPIGQGSTPEHRLTNWAVCVQLADAGDVPPRRENWARPAVREEFAEYVDLFHLDAVDLKALVAATETVYEYPMCDRDPLPHWSVGRVTLLGDAAHPMYPMGSNGGSQTIIDARCVADCLATGPSVEAALQRYQDTRLPVTSQIVLMNRQGGPEGVIDAVEERAPDGFADVEDVISRGELEEMLRRYTTTAGFSREQVNR